MNYLPTLGEMLFAYSPNIKAPIRRLVSLSSVYQFLGGCPGEIGGEPNEFLRVTTEARKLRRLEIEADKAGNTEQAKAYKAENTAVKSGLPVVLFSNLILPGRAKDDPTRQHTGFFVLDFDHLADPKGFFAHLAKSPYVALAFLSPSGDGAKAVVFVAGAEREAHKAIFTQLCEYFEQYGATFGAKIDPSGANDNRLCYLPIEPQSRHLNLKAQDAGALLDLERVAADTKFEKVLSEKANEIAETEATDTNPDFERYPESEAFTFAENILKKAGFEYAGRGAGHDFRIRFALLCLRFGVSAQSCKQYVFLNYPPSDGKDDFSDCYRTKKQFFGTWKRRKWYLPRFEKAVIKYGGQFFANDKKAVSELLHTIEKQRRTYIESRTGTGKTRFVFDTLKAVLPSEAQIVFCVPTQTLGEQTANEYKAPFIWQKSDASDYGEATFAPVVVATFDQVRQWRDLSKKWLVIDEAHHLPGDSSESFKKTVCDTVFEKMEGAGKVILLSGTPTPFFEKEGFKYIKLDSETDTRKTTITPVYYSGDTKKALSAYLLNSAKKAGESEFVFCLFDSKKGLKQVKKALLSELEQDEILTLTSETKEGEGYANLIKNESIRDGVRVVLCTRLIADGVNIRNKNVSEIVVCEVKSPEMFAQIPARFRSLEMVNLTAFYRDFERKSDAGAAWTPADLDTVFEKETTAAKSFLEATKTKDNGSAGAALNLKGRKGSEANLVFRGSDGKFRVSVFTAQHDVLQYRDNNLTPAERLDLVCRNYPYFKILEAKDFDTEAETTPETAATLSAAKRTEKEAKENVFKLLETRPAETLHSGFSMLPKQQQKEFVRHLPPSPMPGEVENFKAENGGILAENLAIFTRYFSARKHGFEHGEAVKIATMGNNRRGDFYAKMRAQTLLRLKAEKRLNGLEARAVVEAERLFAARAEISKALKFSGDGLTNAEILAIIESVTGRGSLSTNAAISFLGKLFDVRGKVEKRNGKPVRIYAIGEALDLDSVFSSVGEDSEAFFARATEHISSGVTQLDYNTIINTNCVTPTDMEAWPFKTAETCPF